MVKRIAIIPARGGSKRIKNKNIKNFQGKKLILHTIDEIKNSKLFHKIHVSTDSKRIRIIVEKNKQKIDFLRPKRLSKDNIPTKDVVNYTLKKYSSMSIEFDEVWLFFVSNPFLNNKHIKNAYKIYKSNNKRASVMSVSKYNYPIEWATTQDKSNFLKPYFKNKKNKIQKNIFCEAGMFVIYQKNYLINQNKLKYIPYEIPIWETVDIDTIEDFRLAKKLLKISKR
tara:strand:- start:1430 stop:2107 length:678 start_codon:yes stop_codon:yes gene_type:complete